MEMCWVTRNRLYRDSLILKILFVTGTTNFKIFVLKVDILSELRMILSSLFHSDIDDGKKRFLIQNCGIPLHFLV